MERTGFIASDLGDKPMTLLPALFAGAFIANHPTVKKETIDAIFEEIPNKFDFIGILSEMYQDPIMTLMEEKDENSGNVKWEKNWN
jgi:hypothetical protein